MAESAVMKKRPVPEELAGFDPTAKRNATNIDRSNATRTVPMKLLVLGLSRTGTSSLRQAFFDLSIFDVYHFTSIVNENPTDCKLWVRALEWKLEGKGTWTKKNWDALLGHCMAVSDHPCLTFTDELLETYPDAKVILTVRDNVDVWHESVMETIWPFVELLIKKDVSVWRRMWRKFLDPDPFGRMTELFHLNPEGMYHEFPTQGKTFYEKHNAKIRRVVPEERLLEYNVKQGWGPLCEFLGYEIPEWDFPRVNERNVFISHQQSFAGQLNWVVMKNVLKYVGSPVVVGLAAWFALRKRR
ncbi:uncharacterized protein PAC_15017 [Phialocephala subalpina]|uniref:NAD dependent epimerase/dehydratase n=1 Tax=Phialocephala subalpina TaxID=576137 RepID=A0A1L7XJI4_9HELO|nr:uncharacterized protein PAC_15017 [Phialocephala subalpina]